MYLLHGKINAKAGQAETLADLLLEASSLMSKAKGCRLYVIGKETSEPDAVYVTEIWDTKTDHDNSLLLDGVKEIIAKAMPVIDGRPSKGQELEILGGHFISSLSA